MKMRLKHRPHFFNIVLGGRYECCLNTQSHAWANCQVRGHWFHLHLWLQGAFEKMPITRFETKSWTLEVSRPPVVFTDQQSSKPSHIETCHPCGHGPTAGQFFLWDLYTGR